MLDAKEAATKALEYFESLFQGAVVSQILLEEVELTDDRKFWNITFGYTFQSPNPFQSTTSFNREFKIFKVNSETGEVVAMKIKTLK